MKNVEKVLKLISLKGSVADPGCLSLIPDPTFFHPGSWIPIYSLPDPGFTSKNLSILPENLFFKLLEI